MPIKRRSHAKRRRTTKPRRAKSSFRGTGARIKYFPHQAAVLYSITDRGTSAPLYGQYPVIVRNGSADPMPTLGTASYLSMITVTPYQPDIGYGLQYGGSLFFSLRDVANQPELTALFDQYRIKAVHLEFDYLSNSAAQYTPVGIIGATEGSAVMPTINYVEDNDDATALPTSLGYIQQYQRFKQWTFRGTGKPLRITLRPRPKVAGPLLVDLPDNVKTTMMGSNRQFMDCGYSTVPFYGLKFWINNWTNDLSSGLDAPVSGVQSNLRIQVIYDLEMRDVR